MSKFPEGPYEIDGGTFIYKLGPEGTNLFQCQVSSSGQERISQEEVEAIARLFAAAPELLDALEAIIGACDACGKADDRSLVDEFTEAMESTARAAIAKAKGI